MMPRLIKVEKENISFAWKDALPYLEKSLVLTPEYTLMDVYQLVKDGSLTLWMFYNDEKKKAFGSMVTEIIEHPQKRLLNIFLLSSDDFEGVKFLFADFIEYLRLLGVDGMECAGRFGLERLLKDLGFKKSYIVMSIDVN